MLNTNAEHGRTIGARARIELVGGEKQSTFVTRVRHDATLDWHSSNHSSSLLGVGNER